MAFKIPRPTYDAEVVAKIEEFLDQNYTTEVEYTEKYPDDGIEYTYARGRARKSYPRPMFQIIPRDAFSGSGHSVTPCQCDRFDRSWNCELHPEISWDPKRRRWDRPCTGDRTRCDCTPCYERRQRAQERSSGYTDMGSDGLRPPQGLYDRLVDMYARPLPDPAESPYRRVVGAGRCTCSMCQPPVHTCAVPGRGDCRACRDDTSYEATVIRENRALRESLMEYARREALTSGWPVEGLVLGRQARVYQDGRIEFQDRRGSTNVDRIRYVGDPNEGRPGYHYDALTDRWLRDTSDPLGDFRAGGEVGAEERLAAEWERQNGIPLADALRQINRVPPELGPTSRDWLANGLADAIFPADYRQPFTLEIESETEQGSGPLAIEVEPGSGSTT